MSGCNTVARVEMESDELIIETQAVEESKYNLDKEQTLKDIPYLISSEWEVQEKEQERKVTYIIDRELEEAICCNYTLSKDSSNL